MDNFDKEFQDKLNQINETDFEFKPAAWERFHAHREKSPKDRKGAFYLWLKRNSAAAAIILLLLISNIFFAHQSVSTRYEVTEISKKFEKLATAFESIQFGNDVEESDRLKEIEDLNKDLISSKETIIKLNKENEIKVKAFQTELKKAEILVSNIKMVYENMDNAIYENSKNKVNNRKAKSSIFNDDNFAVATKTPNLSTIGESKKSRIIDNIINNNYIKTDKSDELVNENLLANKSEMEAINTKLDFLETPLLNLELTQNNQIYFGKLPKSTSAYGKISFRDKLILFGEQAKPTNSQVGLNFQLGFIPAENGVAAVTDLQTGLNASTLFFNRIRLNTGINFWLQSYKYDNLDNLSDEVITGLIANLPTPVPTNPQDDLDKIEGQILGFSFPLTAQVLLGKKNSKWQPFIGFGMIGRYFNHAQFEYYFSDINNIYNTYEVKYPEDIKQFDFNLLTSNIGVSYQLSEQLELETLFNYSKSNVAQPIGIIDLEQFGGQLNIKYNF